MADEKVPGDPTEQHPALAGDKAAEVAQRSPDASQGTMFGKIFVMSGEIPKEHPQHESNCIRVLEEALQRGLHPKGKAKLVRHEVTDTDRLGKRITTCTYAVDVEPAVTDTEAHKTVTPSSELNEQATKQPSSSAE